MLKGVAVVGLVAIVSSTPARAAEHLVSPATVRATLQDAAQERESGLARIDGLLSSPLASRTAARLGVDLGTVRAALPALDDNEVRELAARAAALGDDPAAGLSHDVEELLVIFLIVAIVIIVIKAV